VRFFSANGSLIGKAQEVSLSAGASTSVDADPSATGLIRAILTVIDRVEGDKEPGCAVKGTFELFDTKTGATVAAVPGAICLGDDACEARDGIKWPPR
jgi:hypothetical protein